MKLESQVASLQLSKKLKELGVVQESAFYWEINLRNDWTLYFEYGEPRMNANASAFTASELGVMLPDGIGSFKTSTKGYSCRGSIGYASGFGFQKADTEANARAKMLVYLLDQKIIPVDEVNKSIRGEA